MNNLQIESIKNKIYTFRGKDVMFDSDLAEFYGIETRALNQAVKRNIERFPEEFMFQLSSSDLDNLRSQIVTSKNASYNSLRSQIATLENEDEIKNFSRHQNGISKSERGGRRYSPYVFTEQGVAMLSSVLKSKTAIEVSIQIMNAFVTMRRFLSSNAQVFQRLDRVELKQLEYDKKFKRVFDAIENKSLKPSKGIFYEGQIFDAYNFISDLIRTAKKSIILIDNYVDDSVLMLFSKCDKTIDVIIYTKLNKQLELDLKKYNSQYAKIEIKEFNKSHDRFMIIDNKEVYHLGASLKDLGKKWFAFSRFDKNAIEILEKL